MSAGMAGVIAVHQKHGMGMSGDSPDICKCRAKVYAAKSDGYIEDRRDEAFAAHVADALLAAGYGDVREARVEAIRTVASEAKARGDVGEPGGRSVEAFLNGAIRAFEAKP